MIVGVCEIVLIIHESNSLKTKRRTVKKILGKVRSKFDLSIAEVDYQDMWGKCSLGFAVVTNESGHAHKMLETVVNFIENLYLAEIIDSHIEIVHY